MPDDQRAIVGGHCEVIGIRNDYFDYEPFSKEREEDNRNVILQGEYEGDEEIIRVKSSKNPKKNIEKVVKNSKKLTDK